MLLALTDVSWTDAIIFLAVIAAISLLAIIILLRTPRISRFRVGFFVERDEMESNPDDEDTDEWPMQER